MKPLFKRCRLTGRATRNMKGCQVFRHENKDTHWGDAHIHLKHEHIMYTNIPTRVHREPGYLSAGWMYWVVFFSQRDKLLLFQQRLCVGGSELAAQASLAINTSFILMIRLTIKMIYHITFFHQIPMCALQEHVLEQRRRGKKSSTQSLVWFKNDDKSLIMSITCYKNIHMCSKMTNVAPFKSLTWRYFMDKNKKKNLCDCSLKRETANHCVSFFSPLLLGSTCLHINTHF